MTTKTKAEMPPFPKPFPLCDVTALTREQKLQMSFSWIISRINQVIENPRKSLPGLKELSSFGSGCYLLGPGSTYSYIVSTKAREGLAPGIRGLAASISPLYFKAWDARREAALGFIRDKILEVKEDQGKPLPHFAEGKGSLCLLAGKRYGIGAMTMVNYCYNEASRKALTPEMAALASSLTRLYAETEKVKKKAAVTFIKEKILETMKDPKKPLPNLADGKGNLCALAAKKYAMNTWTLTSYIRSKEARDSLHDEELAGLAASVTPLYYKADMKRKTATLKFIGKKILEAKEDLKKPLPKLSSGPGSFFAFAAKEYGLTQGAVTNLVYCAGRSGPHDKRFSALAASIPSLYREVKAAKKNAARRFLRKTILELRDSPAKPLPKQKTGPGSLCSLASKECGVGKESLLSPSIRQLYLEVKRSRSALRKMEAKRSRSSLRKKPPKVRVPTKKDSPAPEDSPAPKPPEERITWLGNLTVGDLLKRMDSPSGHLWWHNALMPEQREGLLDYEPIRRKAKENGWLK